MVFSGFLHHWIKLTARYNWNIVESGVKHHNHNPLNLITNKYFNDISFVLNGKKLKMESQHLLIEITGARGTDHPPFFLNLFSIKFLYFFIISSLFSYFNLFVSIFIQSHVNNNLYVSTLYRYYRYGYNHFRSGLNWFRKLKKKVL